MIKHFFIIFPATVRLLDICNAIIPITQTRKQTKWRISNRILEAVSQNIWQN